MAEDQGLVLEGLKAASEVAIARAFGRKPSETAVTSVNRVARALSTERASVKDRFRDAGLCEESARRAADGLASGEYLSFADAALAQTMFDGRDGRPRMNPNATPELIRSVAEVLGDQPVTDEQIIQEAALGLSEGRL